MNALKLLLLASLLAIGSAQAQDGSKPGLTASRTLSVVAQVTAIDHESRQVTIEDEEGESFEFTVGEDVRNLDQVQSGDFVIAQIHQEVDIQVQANPEGLAPSADSLSAAARAEAGAMPGAVIGEQVRITAVVTDIDLEANTYTLRGPLGNSMTFEAMNPENLKRGAVGDLVVVTVTQSLGVLVERPAAD